MTERAGSTPFFAMHGIRKAAILLVSLGDEVSAEVLERFQSGDEVDDETLDADLRSVFYTLEGKRMLSFRRVEYTREDGDKRRAFYWKLRSDGLIREIPVDTGERDVDVYASLPADAWRHTAGA